MKSQTALQTIPIRIKLLESIATQIRTSTTGAVLPKLLLPGKLPGERASTNIGGRQIPRELVSGVLSPTVPDTEQGLDCNCKC